MKSLRTELMISRNRIGKGDGDYTPVAFFKQTWINGEIVSYIAYPSQTVDGHGCNICTPFKIIGKTKPAWG